MLLKKRVLSQSKILENTATRLEVRALWANFLSRQIQAKKGSSRKEPFKSSKI